jgi:hypothetical protein
MFLCSKLPCLGLDQQDQRKHTHSSFKISMGPTHSKKSESKNLEEK